MRQNLGFPSAPSYQEMGLARPEKRKDDRPCFDHKPLPIKFVLINEHQVGRDERRRQEREMRYKKDYDNSLGEKHMTRLEKQKAG